MNGKISGKQMEATIAMFIIGSSLVIGPISEARHDTWICIAIAFLLNIPLVYIHSRIIELYPGRDYFGNIIRACGKRPGKAICAALLIYAFHIAAMVCKEYCVFIQTISMHETPFIFILVSIMLIVYYVSKKRINVVACIAKFTLPILIITVALTVLFAFSDFDYLNIKPVLKSGYNPLLKSALLSFALPFAESIFCAPLFSALDPGEKVFPIFIKGMLIGFLILMIANLRNLFILGDSQSIFLFPSYEAISVIRIGNFFTRIEVVIGFNLMLAGFIKVCVIYYACAQSLQRLFDFADYAPLFAPCALIILTYTMLVSSSTEEALGWFKYHAAFSLPFQVLIPLAVWSIATRRAAKCAKR